MALPKTPVSILQEVLTKKGTLPIFECLEKTGLQHKPMFKFKASALNESVEAEAPTKRDAKQEAAKLLLKRLVELHLCDGNELMKLSNSLSSPISTTKTIQMSFPIENAQTQPSSSTESQYIGLETQEIPHQSEEGVGPNNGVVFLEYFCQKYQLPIFPQYTLIAESGPPHAKEFTVQVVLGIHKASATSNSKKQARHMAASQLYLFLNEKLHRIDNLRQMSTEAIQKEEQERKEKSDKVAKLYSDIRYGPSGVSQMSMEEYKSTFQSSIDVKKRNTALEILNKYVIIRDPVDVVEKALKALGLEFEWQILPRHDKKETHVLEIAQVPSSASIVTLNPMNIPNYLRGATAMEAVTYLKNMLTQS